MGQSHLRCCYSLFVLLLLLLLLSPDVSGDVCQAVHTFHLFNKLFRECRDGFVDLTTDACNFLTEAHRGVASKLIVVIEIIMNDWECPHVFLDYKVSSVAEDRVSLGDTCVL